MALRLPASIKLPKTSLLESLGKGLGSGFEKGVSTGLTNVLSDYKANQKLKAASLVKSNEAQQKAVSGFGKSLQDSFKIYSLDPDDFTPEQKAEMIQEGQARIQSGEDPTAVLNDTIYQSNESLKQFREKQEGDKDTANFVLGEENVKKLDQQQQPQEASLFSRIFGKGQQEPLPREQNQMPKTPGSLLPIQADKQKLAKEFQEGTRESAIGSVLGQQLTDDEMKEMGGKNWRQLISRKSGSFVGDAPLIAVGSYLGLQTGNPLMVYQGAMMLPSLVKSTADEVWKNVRDEDKFTLEKGGASAAKVAKDVAKSSINATLLSKIPGLEKTLKQVPALKNILENNVAKTLLGKSSEVGILGTVNPLLEGRMPTKEDYVDALATVASISLIGLPGKLGAKIQQDALRSGFSAKEFAQKVKDGMAKAKVSVEDVNNKKGSALQKINRIVTDITKEGQLAKEGKPTETQEGQTTETKKGQPTETQKGKPTENSIHNDLKNTFKGIKTGRVQFTEQENTTTVKGVKTVEPQKTISMFSPEHNVTLYGVGETWVEARKNLITEFEESGFKKSKATETKKGQPTETQEGESTTQKTKKIGLGTEKAEIGKEQLKEKGKMEKRQVQKAAKSPIVEEVFKEKKEVKHRESTIAKEESRIADLEEKISPIKKDLKRNASELVKLEMKERNAKTEKQRTKLQEDISKTKWQNKELVKEIKDLEFERRHKTKPKSYLERAEDIKTTIEKIREDVKSPKEVDVKKAEEAFAKHKAAVDLADSILKSGSELSPEQSDYNLKLKRQYAEAYKDVIKENNDLMDKLRLKKTAKAKKAVAEAEQMNKILEQRIKRAEADIIKQRNKRGLQKLTKGAKGAFMKKSLGELRTDIALLQKSLFKQNKIKSEAEFKSSLVTKKAFEKLAKSPTESVARDYSDSIGENYETISKDAKKTVEGIVGENVSDSKVEAKVKEYVGKIAKSKTFAPAVIALNRWLKSTTGFGFPQSFLNSTIRRAQKIGTVEQAKLTKNVEKSKQQEAPAQKTTTVSGLTYLAIKLFKQFNDHKRKEHLKNLKSASEKSSYRKQLKNKGLSTARINKITKKARAA